MEYMRTLPDKYFDLCIADPPYGNANSTTPVAHAQGGNRYKKYEVERTGGTWAAKYGRNIKEWDEAPPQEFFDELFRVSKEQIIWGANYFTMPPTRCFIVWKKLTISEAFTMAMAEYAWTSFNSNAKVFECMPQCDKSDPRFHPTQKPVNLIRYLIRTYTNVGGVILDSCIGSGTTAIACIKEHRHYIGFELNKEYYDKACQRIEEERQQLALNF